MSHAVIAERAGSRTISVGTEVPVIDTTPRLNTATHEPSPLMQLPAGIRLMILRELLLSSQPIAERQVYVKQPFQPPSKAASRDAKGQQLGKSATMTSGYRLTPAFLSTYQQLLQEGWPILYEQNTLVIQIYSGLRPHYGASCLCSFFYMCMFIYALDGKSMFETKWCPRLTPRARAWITRFKNLHIDLDALYETSVQGCGHYALFTDMVSEIKPFLTDPCLQLAVSGASAAQSSSLLHRKLKVFQLLRCKGFKIYGTSLLDGVSNDIENAATIKAIKDTVTSDRPISSYHELAKAFKDTISLLKDFYGMKGDMSGLSWLHSARREIYKAGMDQNSEKFFQLRAGILGRLREGIAKLE